MLINVLLHEFYLKKSKKNGEALETAALGQNYNLINYK